MDSEFLKELAKRLSALERSDFVPGAYPFATGGWESAAPQSATAAFGAYGKNDPADADVPPALNQSAYAGPWMYGGDGGPALSDERERAQIERDAYEALLRQAQALKRPGTIGGAPAAARDLPVQNSVPSGPALDTRQRTVPLSRAFEAPEISTARETLLSSPQPGMAAAGEKAKRLGNAGPADPAQPAGVSRRGDADAPSGEENIANTDIPEYNGDGNEASERHFVGVLYLNKSRGAGLQGHAAVMLVTDDGKGILYSYISDDDRALDMAAAHNTPGKLMKAVDPHHDPVLVDVEKFLQIGQVRVPKFNEEKTTDDLYDRYLYIPAADEQGQAMYQEAEKLYRSPKDYNLYANNCNHTAQQILSAAGLDFAPTEGGSANEEAVLASLALALPTGSLSPAAWWTAANYLYDRYDKTIPNAAYDYGAQLAGKRGWTAGETGAGADWWNLFK
jgi:hypothetical protein